MANSKKKAVTKPAAKKPTSTPKKTAPEKTPTSAKATKLTATKKAIATPKKAAAKTPPKQASAKAAKPAMKPAPKAAASTAKGSRLQLGKASAAKAPAKPTAAKKGNAKPAPALAENKTTKKAEANKAAPTRQAVGTRVSTATGAQARSATSARASAAKAGALVAGEPLSSGAAVSKKPSPAKSVLRTSNGGGSAAKAVLRTPPARPISFTLDEVRAIAKSNETKSEPPPKPSTAKTSAKKASASTAAAPAKTPKPVDVIPPAKPSHVKAASLADILGFNPNAKGPEAAGPVPREVALVPEKFKRYYKLLVELREHLTGQIDQHSEDTLKRSSKDDAGDLSSYGQHMADAGTDTFDRDFALSLVSSEQEALSEIEAAIKRITDGSYGVCEVTGQPIAKARLLAVPFTRYSAEAQKEIERNHYRVRTQAGLFGELGGEDGGKIMDADGD